MRGIAGMCRSKGDSKTFLSESSFNGDAGAWLVVCTGSGRQRGGPLVRAGGRTHAVQHEQDKRTSVSERNGTSFTFTCIQDEPTSYIENMEEI